MTPHPTRLHLGSGKRKLAGFLHVDLCDLPHIDYNVPVENLPMFDDNSVDLIYASHVLEYFDRDQVKDVLKEWYRVLKLGGVLRLAVPDFDALIKLYHQQGDINLILGPLYGRWLVEGTDNIVYHHTVYNYKALKEVLEAANFYNIRPWDWREVFIGKNLGFDDFSQSYHPHMDKANGLLISLNIESHK